MSATYIAVAFDGFCMVVEAALTEHAGSNAGRHCAHRACRTASWKMPRQTMLVQSPEYHSGLGAAS